MTTTPTLEQRLTLLEEQVQQLHAHITRETVSGRTTPDFLERFSGIFADDPSFAEAVHLGRAWRDEDRPLEDTNVVSIAPRNET